MRSEEGLAYAPTALLKRLILREVPQLHGETDERLDALHEYALRLLRSGVGTARVLTIPQASQTDRP
eukprot:110545-Pleurochrysis_carterae.AAC.2